MADVQFTGTNGIIHFTGTSGFIHCSAEIQMHFPVGHDGKAHACCDNCFYYRSSSNRCGITMKVCFEAKKYVGDDCPFITDLQNYFLGGNTDNDQTV